MRSFLRVAPVPSSRCAAYRAALLLFALSAVSGACSKAKTKSAEEQAAAETVAAPTESQAPAPSAATSAAPKPDIEQMIRHGQPRAAAMKTRRFARALEHGLPMAPAHVAAITSALEQLAQFFESHDRPDDLEARVAATHSTMDTVAAAVGPSDFAKFVQFRDDWLLGSPGLTVAGAAPSAPVPPGPIPAELMAGGRMPPHPAAPAPTRESAPPASSAP